MRFFYTLRIHTSIENYLYINNLLGVEGKTKNGWAYEIVENKNDDPINFMDTFLSILENKIEKLQEVNISTSDIEFWLVYEYENQCNLEFDPNELLRIGEKGISLCISCYEKDDNYFDGSSESVEK
jgi:hypothetical protein